MNNGIDKICSQEKWPAQEVIYFLLNFLAVKQFLEIKYKKPLRLGVT